MAYSVFKTLSKILCKWKQDSVGQSQPASATLRNLFEKDLSRCQEIEFFPRSGVDFLPYPGDFPLRDGADVRPFGYILSDQLVGVLYGSLLPCAVGIGEIHGHVQLSGYPFVFRELAAVIRGDGLQSLTLVRQEHPPHGFGHRYGLFSVLELFHEQEVRTPFRECEDGVAVPVNDEVHLPVTETTAVGLGRTPVYAHTVADVRGLGLMPAGGLALILHPMAAVRGEISAFITADDGVDGLMRDIYTFTPEASGYLPGRPLLLTDQFCNAPFLHGRQTSVAGRMTLAGFRHVMCLVPYILAVGRGVASDFAAYRRFVDSYGTSNHFQSLTLLSSQVNCIPLLTG